MSWYGTDDSSEYQLSDLVFWLSIVAELDRRVLKAISKLGYVYPTLVQVFIALLKYASKYVRDFTCQSLSAYAATSDPVGTGGQRLACEGENWQRQNSCVRDPSPA